MKLNDNVNYITNLDFMVSNPLLRGAGGVFQAREQTHTPAPLKRGLYKIQIGHVLLHDQLSFYRMKL